MKELPFDFIDISEQSRTASSPTAYLFHSSKSPLLKKNINKVFQGKVDEQNLRQTSSVFNTQIADSLGQLLEDLNMTEECADNQSQHSTDEETEDNTLQTEMEDLGLPVSFGKQKRNSETKKKG